LGIFGNSIFAYAGRAAQIAQKSSGQLQGACHQSLPPFSMSRPHYVVPIVVKETGSPNRGRHKSPHIFLERMGSSCATHDLKTEACAGTVR
jgi:hypothetical protein